MAKSGEPGNKAKKRKGSNLEERLAFQLRALGVPKPETEYRFHPERRWRFDFAWPSVALAVEVEGGIWSGGRHTRGLGFKKDCEKYNEASKLGWTVLRFVGSDINAGSAAELITFMLAKRGLCNVVGNKE